MKLVFEPSLEYRTVVKIAISLWNQNDIRNQIKNMNFSSFNKSTDWSRIEKRVQDNVSQLQLPELLKEKLFIIKPIGLQIFKWMVYHLSDLQLFLNRPVEFYWTPLGIIDRKKTAEVLVKDVNLDPCTRYTLACINCLEDDIRKLWNYVTEDLKYYSVGFSHNREQMQMDNIKMDFGYEFYESACSGNKVAAEYFLQQLTPQQRDKYLVRAAKKVEDTEVYYFLLTKLDEEQQEEVYKHDSSTRLRWLLAWPFQSFFMEVANCMWDFLTKKDFDLTLTRILIKVSDYCWDYRHIFNEFWLKSPACLKSLILDKLDETRVFESLLLFKDYKSTSLILKDATPEQKMQLIYSAKALRYMKRLIFTNKEFLKFFIRECFSSEDEMLVFKKYFIQQCVNDKIVIDGHILEKLLGSSDHHIHKNKCVEGNGISSKRFCK